MRTERGLDGLVEAGLKALGSPLAFKVVCETSRGRSGGIALDCVPDGDLVGACDLLHEPASVASQRDDVVVSNV